MLEERLPQQSEEGLLFYGALAAATERVWLSYPTSDAQGKPTLRSHYVDEALRLFSDPPQEQIARLSEVTPAAETAACPRELAESALKALWAEGEAGGEALEAVQEASPGLLPRVLRAARVEDERGSRQAPGEFDGVIGSPLVNATLRSDFGAAHKFSAGQFSRYGRCPISFFFERVLGLEALAEPTEEVEALELGLIAHRALNNFFRERAQGMDRCAPLTAAELETESLRMSAEVARVFRNMQGQAGHRKLWELTEAEVRDDLLELLSLEVQKNEKEPRSVWVTEFTYGKGGDFALGQGDDQILVEGRIDRVDLVHGGEGMQFILFDYKTGGGRSVRCIIEGTDFQLPLYCMAAREKVFVGREAECKWWAYYRVRRPVKWMNYARAEARGENELPIPELLEIARRHMIQHARRIRGGAFPVTPKECRNCDFDGICRFNVHRMNRKTEA